jgi:gamma-butyrobetaine dioxygenase
VDGTGDFDSYAISHQVVGASLGDRWVVVDWSDGSTSRFHHIWLRDNCPCAACVHQGTKEQTFELLAVGADFTPSSVSASGDALVMTWPDGHESAFHAGWLRAHRYDSPAAGSARVPWDASTFTAPPSFDGPAVLADDDALYDWLIALRTYGATLLHNVPCTDFAVGDVASRIGIVRETNFGVLWDVWSEPDPVTNANTSLPLPPHVDLPTREYQPGLQLLHCVENEASGGLSILVDGFRVAAALRERHPVHYDTLTTVGWNWANRSKTTDYRWTAPLIVTDHTGEVVEVRAGNWLRAPLVDAPFDQVEAAYAAYRAFFALTYEPEFAVTFRLEPGDLMAFDNRRILHARGAFTDPPGEHRRRHLRGCYTERDELHSRIRMLERTRRASAAPANL